jgi:aldose 1-epimerase
MSSLIETYRNGKKIELFHLSNPLGMEVSITNFGAKIVSILVPDKNGLVDDVVLGYDNIEDYFRGNPYFGAIVGRYANRIANGQFSLEGKTYTLNKNNGSAHLHGGKNGFHNVVWDAQLTLINGEEALILHYLSRAGEENYPGNMDVTVIYQLTNNNELKIQYQAKTDQTTIINLTNHAYFNLSGEGKGNILNHEVFINADKFTPVGPDMIPTGELRKVENTPFDFRQAKPIGKDIDKNDEQLLISNGYDHNFVLNKEPGSLVLAATAFDPQSGRVMDVLTDQPGMQFYTENFAEGDILGKGGKVYGRRSAFCFETQHFPDSPNHRHFPSTELKPGEQYIHNSIYKFYIQ